MKHKRRDIKNKGTFESEVRPLLLTGSWWRDTIGLGKNGHLLNASFWQGESNLTISLSKIHISHLHHMHRNSWYYALGRCCQAEMQELKEECQGQDNEEKL